jgi:hypothetical protein
MISGAIFKNVLQHPGEMLPNKSLQRLPGGICRASCSGFHFCGQQARQLPGAAELGRQAAWLRKS